MRRTIETTTTPLPAVRTMLLAMIASEAGLLVVLVAEQGAIVAAAVAGFCTLANTALTLWLTGRRRDDPPRKRRRDRRER